jgi:DNA-binding transcriptional MerR regulator
MREHTVAKVTKIHPAQHTALRTALVSKLTGLSPAVLQHWHATGLQEAERRKGERGTPRLYSWIDYRRLCVFAELRDQHVPVQRIRAALPFLDTIAPRWWEVEGRARAYKGSVAGSAALMHVVLRTEFDTVADVRGRRQVSFRESLEFVDEDPEAAAAELDIAIEQISAYGPLYKQHTFQDAVYMDPAINAALPTCRGTGLETSFIAASVHHGSELDVARMYRMDPGLVHRAVEFEEAA